MVLCSRLSREMGPRVLLIFKELLSVLALFVLLLEYSVPSVLVPWIDCMCDISADSKERS